MMIQPEKKKGDENEGAFSAFPSQHPPLALRGPGDYFPSKKMGKILSEKYAQTKTNNTLGIEWIFPNLYYIVLPLLTGKIFHISQEL